MTVASHTGSAEGPIEESEVPSLEDIPKLTKDNYGSWKVKIEKYLRRERLWGFVEETIPKPLDEDPEVLIENAPSEYQLWVEKHGRVQSVFKHKCGPWALPYIEGKGRASSVWSQLEIMFKNDEISLTATGMCTNYTWWLPLYRAIVEGDLKTVLQLVSKNESVLTARLTSEGEIPLHVAAQHGRIQIVEKMVEKMPVNELARAGKYRRSALHIAASDGNLKIVKILVEKHKALVMLTGEYYDNNIPITVAARAGS
ncbi:uncharacterized protein LOC122665937 [Telopea speciosissima]|uniref:uncharacterized protein LOC122665937 n=1 Tax=Telopea speciosissima TaxID=54955 RepID=UPI001CC4B610|nr:uncharacterized protein LOC122665937 [Telopea speciosissima]